MDRFREKMAIVTGAGSGMGKATAERLAAEGARVACLDLMPATAEATAAGITDVGGTATGFSCDVSDPASVSTAVRAAADSLGAPAVLVNCAGIGRFANSHEMPHEAWSRIVAVNLTGTFLMCQAALRYMLEGGGAIVNLASSAGLMGQPYSAAYCASKGGVIQLTRALADEYVGRGIRVNAVAPGGIDTPMQTSFYELPEGADGRRLAKLRTPLGMGEPAEVARLIAFIASDDGRYMTGAIIPIDGGITV